MCIMIIRAIKIQPHLNNQLLLGVYQIVYYLIHLTLQQG